mmetsp:Transcript_6821/g.12023  ORF Transcript_6821/g.12023 Transcript_6821/m.12023 type:complete len:304 (-) Transcript_6821:211-1122(-)
MVQPPVAGLAQLFLFGEPCVNAISWVSIRHGRLRASDPRPPSNDGGPCIGWVPVAVRSLVIHAMICREYERCCIVTKIAFKQFVDPSYALVYERHVLMVLWGLRAIRVPVRIQAEQVQEEHDVVLRQLRCQRFVFFCFLKHLGNPIKDPSVERGEVFCRKVLFLCRVIRISDMFVPLGKHTRDVRASPQPRSAALVEDVVKLDGVVLPPSGYRANVLVKACNDSYMSRSRFGGNSCMRDAPRTLCFNDLSEERCLAGGPGYCIGLVMRLPSAKLSFALTWVVVPRVSAKKTKACVRPETIGHD